MSHLLTAGILQQASNRFIPYSGPALMFDGISNQVSLPQSTYANYDVIPLPSTAMTMEGWIKHEGGNGDFRAAYTLGGNAYGLLAVQVSSELRFYVYVGTPGSWEGISVSFANYSNQNLFYSFVYDGSNLILYINGSLVRSAPLTGTIGFNPTALRSAFIGRYNADYFRGVISDIRLWNIARTQQQIQDNMNTKLSGAETGLAAYYDFIPGPDLTKLYDRTPNANHGDIIGATWINV